MSFGLSWVVADGFGWGLGVGGIFFSRVELVQLEYYDGCCSRLYSFLAFVKTVGLDCGFDFFRDWEGRGGCRRRVSSRASALLAQRRRD